MDPFMHHRPDVFRGAPPGEPPFGPRGDFRGAPPGEPPFGLRGDFRGSPMLRGAYPNAPRHMYPDRGGYHASPRDRNGHFYHAERGRSGGHVGPPYYYTPDERDFRQRGPGEHFAYKQRHTVGPYGKN